MSGKLGSATSVGVSFNLYWKVLKHGIWYAFGESCEYNRI